MLVFRSTAITAAVFAVALAVPAAAQQPAAKQCSVDEGQPSEVARAYLTVSQVASAHGADPASLKKKLADAVQMLTKSDQHDNPVGHAFELGKVLVLWTSLPDVRLTMDRGTLGYDTNPKDSINLPAAIDSAFTIVETAMPECVSETQPWRSQKVWIDLVNASIQELNAGSLDSADKHATESLVLNRKAPYGFMVRAQVASRRNQLDQAIALFQQTIAAASTDTLYAEVRDQSRMNLGNLGRQAADDDSTHATKYLKIAAEAFRALSADTTATSSYRATATGGLVAVELALGDTAAAKAIYQPELTNPKAFSFNQIVQGGVWATQAADTAGASTLFHAAYQMNPYHRDALSNLALIELRQQKFDSAMTLLSQLKAVDPNGDNARLWLFTYAGMAKKFADLNHDIVARFKQSKDQKLKRVLSDSATLTTDSNRVYTELAVNVNTGMDSIPVLVTFSQFSSQGDSVTLKGTIANHTADAKTYTLKVDFLDHTGAVVVSDSTTVGPVSGNGSGEFALKASGAGITAFRYAPVDK